MSACWACGRPADRRHHATGKDHQDGYLDRRFISPLCHDDHELVHDGWRAQGIERVTEPLTSFDSVTIRLQRTAASYARMDLAHFDADPTEIAEMLVTCVELQRHGIRRLEEVLPDWRDDPGFR